jgi:hypothetical protein
MVSMTQKAVKMMINRPIGLTLKWPHVSASNMNESPFNSPSMTHHSEKKQDQYIITSGLTAEDNGLFSFKHINEQDSQCRLIDALIIHRLKSTLSASVMGSSQ